MDEETYYCINCGDKNKSLFKKYSETVLKLTECEKCEEIADKYVEYDIVIIIIDLVLLNAMAYKHILLNTKFQNFWKLSVILLLLESYVNWTLTSPSDCNSKINKTEPSLKDFDMNIEDLKFYGIFMKTFLKYLCFSGCIYLQTRIYQKYCSKQSTDFNLILKTVTLSSTGIILNFPSIIWDISSYNYHLHFITLYTCLSQLLAYRAVSQSPKIWCLIVIFSSHFVTNEVIGKISDCLDYVIK